MKFSIKYYVLCIMGAGVAFFAFYILHSTFYIPINPNVLAAGTDCQVDTSAGNINARASGLISIGTDSAALTGTFNNPSGICAFDPKAAFISYQLPSYQDLKSKYFDQSKATKVTFSSPLPAISDQTVYYTAGSLTIASTPSGSGTAVVFVDGNLDINSSVTYGTATTGLVFVVKGNVNINNPATVTTVNAVIIAQGQIFTGGAGCTKSSVTAPALTIQGSLISLDSANKIIFCRTLSDNSTAAEIINHQSKYVVILKDIFSGTLQKWTEIAGVPYIAIQLPTPTAAPTPIPTATPIPTSQPPPVLDLAAASTASTTLSWSQSCGTEQYRMLIVVASEWSGVSSQITGITYAGAPLTRLNPEALNINGAVASMWYKWAPASGTNNISVAGPGGADISFAASCWKGAAQVPPANYTSKTGNSFTTDMPAIPSTTTDKVIDGISVLGSSGLNSSGRTSAPAASFGNARIGHSYITGSSPSTSMPWTITGFNSWAMVGARLQQAP